MPPFLRLLPLPKSLTSDLPRPVAAGIGLAVSLPGLAVHTAMSLPSVVLGTTARLVGRYQELAEIGASIVTGRRDDDDVDEFADYPTIEGWGDSTKEVERRLRAVEDEPEPSEETATDTNGDPVTESGPEIELPDDLARAALDREAEPEHVPDRRELPIQDYPSLSLTALRSRLAGLTVGDLEELRAYEQGHAKRLTVLQLLERTIAKNS